jgi:hypothetical protein
MLALSPFNLRVEGGRLTGRTILRKVVTLNPDDIEQVRFMLGGILIIRTSKGTFKIFLLCSDYEKVLEFLLNETKVIPKGAYLHSLFVKLYWWMLPECRMRKILDTLSQLEGRRNKQGMSGE